MRGGNRGGVSPLHLGQTRERVAAGVAKLRAELDRQIQEHAMILIADLDLRALYLAIDDRAAKYLEKAGERGPVKANADG